NVAHANVGRRRAGRSTCESLVDGVVPASIAHSGLEKGHVLVAVVVMIESGPRLVRIHHAHLDHAGLLMGCWEKWRLQSCVKGLFQASAAGRVLAMLERANESAPR